MTALLSVRELTRRFTLPRPFGRRTEPRVVHAVEDVSFEVAPGEVLAIVGESGSGKTTVARVLAGLDAATAGTVALAGRELAAVRTPADQRLVQLVTQNPRAAFNRRRSLRHALYQPLRVHGLGADRAERDALVLDMVERVGLTADHLDRLPSDVSGGELARLVLARALLVRPRVLVLDEPTASLDASVKATVVELLLRLRTELDLGIVLITHEIDIARRLADRAAVMYLGRIVEIGPADRVLSGPRHPYPRMLLASVPVPDPKRVGPASAESLGEGIVGEVPSALAPPPGCAYHPRCPFTTDVCRTERPLAEPTGDGSVACHHPR
ncbi:oligopeptide/dipeptide ABC transporter ATP-binding protein [Embleya sp. NBC_00896]|uniref:oligopeptide/dipeptide ABC transporter ATP-binding protein n=1 Tax=Embleya sp. NBC_00896 TaxID=2975961 RepID=UPI0038655A4A|nr:ABC transporter ATP-binding protein [Embleya sp. NBC_00896]